MPGLVRADIQQSIVERLRQKLLEALSTPPPPPADPLDEATQMRDDRERFASTVSAAVGSAVAEVLVQHLTENAQVSVPSLRVNRADGTQIGTTMASTATIK